MYEAEMAATMNVLWVGGAEDDVVLGPQYAVTRMSTLAEGLAAFSRLEPEVVLLELDLPECRGVETLERFQAQVTQTPILVATRAPDVSLAVDVLKAGAADYVAVTDPRMGRAISDAVERAGQQRKRRELDQIRADFVATASHELRTPLAIIKEFVAIVHDQVVGPVNEEQTECLQSALRNCARLAELIDGTLDLRRLESGQHRYRRGRMDLGELLRSCVRDFEPQARKKTIDLSVSGASQLPDVLGSEDGVTQVVVNLVGNALKFTPDNGHVAVSARVDGDSVIVDVEDSGVGIPEEYRDRIFEKFTRVDETRDAAPGTGLGLAIAKEIVEAHDGSVTVHPGQVRGSRFTFALPAYTPALELRAFLEDAAHCAQAARRALSVTFIRPHLTEDPARPSTTRVRALLHHINRSLRDILRRKGDATLVVPSLQMVVVVAEIDEEADDALRQRIERSLHECMGTTVPLSFRSEVVPRTADPKLCCTQLAEAASARDHEPASTRLAV